MRTAREQQIRRKQECVRRRPELARFKWCGVHKLFLSIAKADDVSIDVLQTEVARPRHVFQFLRDASAGFAATAEEFVHVVIDIAVNTDAERAVASVLGEKEAQLATFDANAQWQA